MKVYVVEFTCGQYSDYRNYVIGVAADEDTAKWIGDQHWNGEHKHYEGSIKNLAWSEEVGVLCANPGNFNYEDPHYRIYHMELNKLDI